MRFLIGLMLGSFITLYAADSLSLQYQWQQLNRLLESVELPKLNTAQIHKPAEEHTSTVSEPFDEAQPAEAEPANFAIDQAEHLHDYETLQQPLFDEPMPEQEVPEMGEELTTSHTVWGNFYSERSARGFARQLSQNLAVPLEVEKRGSTNYAVTYTSSSAEDWQAVQAKLTNILGEESCCVD